MRWLVLCIALILIAPLAAPYDPLATDTSLSLSPPSVSHIFGTDVFGRDVFSRFLYGGQRTLLIAAAALTIAVISGAVLGLLASGGTRTVRAAITMLITALLSIPGILLALIALTVLGQGDGLVALAIGITQIAPTARLVGTAARSVQASEYVTAAAALGAGRYRILWAHVLPNVLPLLISYAGVVFAYAILNSAALTFLGFGGDLAVPDWGGMLYEGRQVFRAAPWVSIAPGLGITILVGSINRAVNRRR